MNSYDGNLSISAYWCKYQDEIEAHRKWDRSADHTTKDAYNKFMDKMSAVCPELACKKPIRDVTYQDIQILLAMVRRSKDGPGQYADSTMQSYTSLLSDLYRYAAARCDATNVMARYSHCAGQHTTWTNPVWKKNYQDLVSPCDSIPQLRARINRLKEGTQNLRRSLNIPEMRKLLKMIRKNIQKDGRYMGLAIMFFTGVRPAECRALRWEDIFPIPGHSDFFCFHINHTLSPHGKEQDHTKTANGFRKIPIHIELAALLKQRYDYIKSMTGETPTGYLCCKENAFGRPCTYNDFANFATKKVLAKLSEEVCYINALLMEEEDCMSDRAHETEDNLTLYVLRRNFWTFLQSSTQMTLDEKTYVMGHDMKKGYEDVRKRFNDPDLLWVMGQKMNRFTVLDDLHTNRTHILSFAPGHSYITIPNTGISYIHIPGDQLTKPVTLRLTCKSLDAGDSSQLVLNSAIHGKYKIEDEITISFEQPDQTAQTIRPNLEYGNLLAVRRKQQKNRQGTATNAEP